jgi:ABC-type polar amino acid transport system ATPase subunit
VADNAARQAALATHADAAQISVDLPLRANLSVQENIAIGLQYHSALSAAAAHARAFQLLQRATLAECASLRDPDLSSEQRFAAKFLRALALAPSALVIDRPALLLPDVPYAHWLPAFLSVFPPLPPCYLVDYVWNQPLWDQT